MVYSEQINASKELLFEKYDKLENILLKKWRPQDDKFILIQVQNIKMTLTRIDKQERLFKFMEGLKSNPLLYPMV